MAIAKVLMLAGLGLLIAGALLHQLPGAFSWFGKLPGDINIQKEHSKVFIPITSMLIVSLVGSWLLNLLRR